MKIPSENNANTFALSLMRLVLKSLNPDLRTLLNCAQTCQGCSEMLETPQLQVSWEVAVKQEFRQYRNLDMRSWLQLSPGLVSALHPLHSVHPLPKFDLDDPNAYMVAWYVGWCSKSVCVLVRLCTEGSMSHALHVGTSIHQFSARLNSHLQVQFRVGQVVAACVRVCLGMSGYVHAGWCCGCGGVGQV